MTVKEALDAYEEKFGGRMRYLPEMDKEKLVEILLKCIETGEVFKYPNDGNIY